MFTRGCSGEQDVIRVLHAATGATNGTGTQPRALRKKMDDQGVEVTPSSPAQFAALIQSDVAKWGKVVRDSGAKID